MLKWPFQGLSDLQLGDEKVTLNHLVLVCAFKGFYSYTYIWWKKSCTCWDIKVLANCKQWDSGIGSCRIFFQQYHAWPTSLFFGHYQPNPSPKLLTVFVKDVRSWEIFAISFTQKLADLIMEFLCDVWSVLPQGSSQLSHHLAWICVYLRFPNPCNKKI